MTTNLAHLSPADQVAAVIAACQNGDMPDLPPFLVKSAAERAAWWEANPPKTQAWRKDTDDTVARRLVEWENAERKLRAEEKERQRLRELGVTKRAEAVGVDPTKFRRWNTRYCRWDYEDVETAIASAPPEAKEAAKAKTRIENKARRRVMAASEGRKLKERATTLRKSGDVKHKVDVSTIKPGSKIELVYKLLIRPEGVTAIEAGKELGCKPHSAGARISGFHPLQKERVKGRGIVFRKVA